MISQKCKKRKDKPKERKIQELATLGQNYGTLPPGRVVLLGNF